MLTPETADYSKCKICSGAAYPKYNIVYERVVTIFECSKCGFHYIDYLDPALNFPAIKLSDANRDRDWETMLYLG